MFSPTTSLLSYSQATATQRAQILHYLQVRLQLHFPTLPERPFVRTLAECRPTLLLTGTQVALSRHELTQLVQYLGLTRPCMGGLRWSWLSTCYISTS
jgi:hypothetical protein